MSTPAEHENARYSRDDYCSIRLEEKIVMSYLERIKAKTPAPKLLDVGCGSGLITAEVQKLGYEVNGVDVSAVAAAKARARGLKVKVANIDQGLPFNDQLFDVVLGGDVIEHIYDPMLVLREAARVLKKTGWLIITVPHDLSLMVRLKTIWGISYQEVMYRRSGYYKHHTFFTYRLLLFMLQTAGFKIKQQERVTNIGRWRQLSFTATPLIFTNEFAIMARVVKK